MRAVLNAYGRALLSQFHGKMLLLSVLPFLLSILVWALLLWWGMQPLVDWLQEQYMQHELFHQTSPWLNWLGLATLRTLVVPFFAVLLLVPLMILTVLIFIGVAAMPFIAKHVGGRHFAQLEKKRGGSLLGGLGQALSTFAVFIGVWLCTLPLYIFPPLAVLSSMLLWGWMTSRVMSYDALADYASAEERAALLRQHRWPLLAMGVVSGAAGSLPALLWVGSAVMGIAFFQVLVMASLWAYVMIFIFTGLWFEYYCLGALAQLRHASFEASIQ
jgi:hypothetical protein